jgi:hypothetical protein
MRAATLQISKSLKTVALLASAIFLLCSSAEIKAHPGKPIFRELKLVTKLPAELPQRILGFAYDGNKFWAAVYLGKGHYATLDPATLNWTVADNSEQFAVIRRVSGTFGSPGGICFADGKLWIAGAYGDSLGLVDLRDWKIERQFKGLQRADGASQLYSGLAFDGEHLWIAWHWFRYDFSDADTQLLLKVNPETGEVIKEYSAPPGTRNDGTHGLTWDGTQLWHAKDRILSSINPTNGAITAEYHLSHITRPSALAWDGQALWIAEFDGKIWKLPFSNELAIHSAPIKNRLRMVAAG